MFLGHRWMSRRSPLLPLAVDHQFFHECKLAFLLKLQWKYIKTSKCESVYLVGAALFLPIAVVLVNYNRASSCIKRYLLECDPPNIPWSPLENNNHNISTRYFVLRIFFIIYLFLALSLMMMLYTGTVLILAPFSVPVKLQFRTWTSSTCSVAPFSPRLPMLKTHAYRKGHIVNYIQTLINYILMKWHLILVEFLQQGKHERKRGW